MEIFKDGNKQTVQVVVVRDDDVNHPVFKGNTKIAPGDGINIDFTVDIVLAEGSEYGLAATYDVYIKKTKGKK